jgi:hypothetical protein
MDANHFRLSESPRNENTLVTTQITMPNSSTRSGNYHIMNTVWNPEHVHSEPPMNPQYNGYISPDQHTTPGNALIQSFAAVVMEKHKQKELEEKRVYAVDIVEQKNSTANTKTAADTMSTWTQQLQEQLKNKQPRETSASSTKQLIHTDNSNNN